MSVIILYIRAVLAPRTSGSAGPWNKQNEEWKALTNAIFIAMRKNQGMSWFKIENNKRKKRMIGIDGWCIEWVENFWSLKVTVGLCLIFPCEQTLMRVSGLWGPVQLLLLLTSPVCLLDFLATTNKSLDSLSIN